MIISAQTTGAKEITARLDRLQRAMATEGEVFWSTPRSAKLGKIHAQGGPSLPARNPYFAEPATAERVQRELRRGVDGIVRGRETSLLPAMERATSTLAEAYRRNVAPSGRMSAEHIGLHASVGQTIASGEKMAPLSARYKVWKRKKFGPKPILVATGELLGSVTVRVRERDGFWRVLRWTV